jgi:Protein of unknown function (DUF1488)
MTLNFPNLSRSYDARRRAVCFWGYDSALEITFFVEADALRKLGRQSDDEESGYLESFDDARDQIIAAARKAYARARPGPYMLAAADF